MLERTYPLLHSLVVISIAGACTADRAAFDLGTGGGFDGGGLQDAGADARACAFGQIICDGNVAKVCDGQGTFVHVLLCTSGCKDGIGCVTCVPNTGVCSAMSGMAAVCNSSGTGISTFACDGLGMSCEPDGCRGVCSPTTLGTSNVGCDFWPTVTANSVWGPDSGTMAPDSFHFGVLIGNTSATDRADITITGPQPPMIPPLQPREVRAVVLPWVPELKGSDWRTPYQPVGMTESVNKLNGAYHIVSNQPIVAYQFSPLEGTIAASNGCPAIPAGRNNCYSYSADASLLIPGHALSGNYVVTGFHALHQDPSPPWNPSKLNMGDSIAITATQATTVELDLRPGQSVLAWPASPHLAPGQAAKFPMNAGQVLELFTPGMSQDETLSGSVISAAGKLQVLSGVGCASIPPDPSYCGHVEDTVVPLEALGKDYVVPVLSGPGPTGARLAHTIRIQSISDGTAVTFEPTMQTGVTLAKGEVVEIANVKVDVRISSTVPFAVTQFIAGRPNAPDELSIGGPSQVTVAPSSQFRTSYSFAASPSYDANFASIVGPTGASVSVDGQNVPLDIAVGASGMSVGRAVLRQNDHLHSLTADKPVGVVVYGFSPYASYAYAGGLDLRRGAQVSAPPPPSDRD